MAWPGKGVELSVYPEIGPNPIIKRITDEDPRDKMHTIEMWAYFTTDTNGGKTLPTGKYSGAFKIGTYAGYNGGYRSEVWTHMVEIIASGAPPNPINGHSF
ncbi:unnamed protein product [Rotaria sp. Silwood1]|nr:unnamed protein product [Rotaria sp. Silwood1]CAF1059725.1 unnamed protein product [Rotaria sp. Silwood1]CAF3404102.1 unnamed protein product [Rotaria sp. Silwood1]CAF3417146.1 unnamed protein product [Rotaria sp. Silwood1]CAF4606851.1 unnamed protein product [Rotaria sp. Silwood1]